MQSKKPTAIDLFQAFDLVGRELAKLENLTSPKPNFLSRTGLSTSTRGGLLGSFLPDEEEARQLELELLDAIKAEVARLEAVLSTEPAIAWVEAQDDYKKLQQSLRRQATLKNGSSFGRPIARFHLLQATLISLGDYALHIDGRKKPGRMTSKDWDKAIAAARTLRDLEKNNGLRLWKAFRQPSAHSYDWVSQLESKLVQQKAASRKPHDDGLTSDRAATRKFTDWLLTFFGAAPPSMVEKFARLIGYDTTSIPRQVKLWEEAYRTHSLT